LRARQEQQEVAISIGDNGIGISADMLPRVFDMFSQSRAALERAEGGMGVGLALVRGLVTLHCGTVEARSGGPGKGSEFVVRLPTTTAVEAFVGSETEAEDPVPSTDLKILVVDDNRDAADTCAMLLEASGHHVQTAYTGRAALELARAFRPHALLLDISLPDVDGYELARQVRATPWGRRAALVAVTGWGQEQDRMRAAQSGFDQHLVKPISADTVESLLQSLVQGKGV
jgi:CheY-like chemotaxis protein